jgi:hypothetical protein
MQHLYALGVWNWFIAAGVLLALELLVPGAFMLWLGLSALLVGVISLFVYWPWQAQRRGIRRPHLRAGQADRRRRRHHPHRRHDLASVRA